MAFFFLVLTVSVKKSFNYPMSDIPLSWFCSEPVSKEHKTDARWNETNW